MVFYVVERQSRIPPAARRAGYLVIDDWDDWFRFSTLYTLVLFDDAGRRYEPGGVKIGAFDMTDGQRRAAIPPQFEALDEQFFSLGQDESYYETLYALDIALRDHVLRGLRDVAADDNLFERALTEPVTTSSLLRSVSHITVTRQYRRILRGDARLTPYDFAYTPPTIGASPSPSLSFTVVPDSSPPSNVHVIIGRNGVGKTTLLTRLAQRLVTGEAESEDLGGLSMGEDHPEDEQIFAGVVSVSFSAFDEFRTPSAVESHTPGMRYAYVGLKSSVDPGQTKSLLHLTDEFATSAAAVRQGASRQRWRRALDTLESDPLFAEAEISALVSDVGGSQGGSDALAGPLFNRLSAGHKIVLLTTTRLVELVEERTLVLIDEPEAHLHPPLLAAFVRALSDLLVQRNGVAIVATHSPVVLQEVPRRCVWKLRRHGAELQAERPTIETFAENVGVLTHEVFGLEVTHSGFHRMLQERADKELAYESVVEYFNGEIGAEGRALIRAMTEVPDRDM